MSVCRPLLSAGGHYVENATRAVYRLYGHLIT